tara:strand:- start:782 stop:1654 length:873 start_codon:yes stop_codon:yes gene_type:complete
MTSDIFSIMENIPILGWFIQSFNKCISIGILNSSCGWLTLIFLFITFGILNAIEEKNKNYIKFSGLHISLSLCYLAYYLAMKFDISGFWLILILISSTVNFYEFLGSLNIKTKLKLTKKQERFFDKFTDVISLIPALILFFAVLYLLNNFLNDYYATRTFAQSLYEIGSSLLNTSISLGYIIFTLIILVIVLVISAIILSYFGSIIMNYIDKILLIENEFEKKWKILIFVLTCSLILFLISILEKSFFPSGEISFFSNLFIIFGGIAALCYIFIFLGAIFSKIKSFIDKY